MPGSVFLVGVENGLRQVIADNAAQAHHSSRAYSFCLSTARRNCQAELGIVFKQGVGPRGAAAFVVLAIRRGGQVAAVDGEHPVALPISMRSPKSCVIS